MSWQEANELNMQDMYALLLSREAIKAREMLEELDLYQFAHSTKEGSKKILNKLKKRATIRFEDEPEKAQTGPSLDDFLRSFTNGK
jgi:hypothetical protein